MQSEGERRNESDEKWTTKKVNKTPSQSRSLLPLHQGILERNATAEVGCLVTFGGEGGDMRGGLLKMKLLPCWQIPGRLEDLRFRLIMRTKFQTHGIPSPSVGLSFRPKVFAIYRVAVTVILQTQIVSRKVGLSGRSLIIRYNVEDANRAIPVMVATVKMNRTHALDSTSVVMNTERR